MKSLLPLLLLALSAGPANAAQKFHQLPRPDGSLIHYSIDQPAADPAGLLVLFTGSGCKPGAQNANLAMVRAAFPAHIALIVEKAGVTPDSPVKDGFTDCPPEFHAGHTPSQRLADNEAVLAHLRPTMPDLPLILFGGSEGGLSVAMLATRVKSEATILLSTATGLAFDEMVLSTVPPEGQSTVRAGFDAARADPEGTSLFAGSSHRFWADILQYRALDDILVADSDFLLIQGGRDTSSPLPAARLGADAFAEKGLCNLTYWEFPALDHGMKTPDGTSQMQQIITMAAHWAEADKPAC